MPASPAQRLLTALVLLLAVSALPALSAGPAPAARPDQPRLPTTIPRHDIDLAQLAGRIHDLVNAERTGRGLKPLERDARLDQIAADHSTDMAARGYFAHVAPDGSDPTARGRRRGYVCRKVKGLMIMEGIGENLFQGALFRKVTLLSGPGGTTARYDWLTPEELAQAAVKGWMDSPGHRENILRREYDRAGLGIAVAKDGKVYVTQNFC